jgi:hypothetical protein
MRWTGLETARSKRCDVVETDPFPSRKSSLAAETLGSFSAK